VVIDAVVIKAPVLAAFARLKRIDGRKVFRDARKPLRGDLREHAKAQASPDGRWAPIASSTKERRARGKGRRRRLLGRLPTAIALTSGADFVRAVSRAKWSRIHQDGGRAGHGAKIPARPFMWASKKLTRLVRDLFTAALSRAWAGR
jgi:phage gpG-like protein